MSEEKSEETTTVRNTLLWIWNTDWAEFVKVVFDIDWGNSPSYEQEYLQKYRDIWLHNPANLFSALDYGKMNKITAAAKEKYGEE